MYLDQICDHAVSDQLAAYSGDFGKHLSDDAGGRGIYRGVKKTDILPTSVFEYGSFKKFSLLPAARWDCFGLWLTYV